MDVKLILLAGLVLVAVGCGEKADPDSYVNAPEVKTAMSAEQSMQRRGMSAEEIANERGDQAASMGGATR
jgi:PBP1b-binding outer membrane lipoprotein LpoB